MLKKFIPNSQAIPYSEKPARQKVENQIYLRNKP